MVETVVCDAERTERFDADRLRAARDAPGTTRVRATEATPEELDRVADAFGVSHLSVEDVRGDVRPKAESFPAHTFLLVETASPRGGEPPFREELHSTQAGVFIGRDRPVTLSTGRVPAVDRVWTATVEGDPRTRRAGPDYAAYRVIDAVVDDYHAVLDGVETTIEAVEEGVLDAPDPDVLTDPNAVRRDLLSFRKVVWPTRDAVGVPARGDPPEVWTATEKYYRDVYDHLVQLVDLTETYRELARGARAIFNTLSRSTNEVTKTLTVVATVILPLTPVVGLCGMNSGDGAANMPELAWPYACPSVVAGMALSTAVLLLHFRRRGWL